MKDQSEMVHKTFNSNLAVLIPFDVFFFPLNAIWAFVDIVKACDVILLISSATFL